MNERVVVGIDGSDNSRRALIWAVDHVRRRGGHLQIVWAWQSPAGAVTPMGMAYVPPPASQLQQHAEEQLAAFLETANRECELGAVVSETIVSERGAAALLCEIAEDADLLVVGSRGLGGFKGLVLGSVSARCASASSCPVAIIPVDWEPGRPARDVVVVGVDGSPNADAAVRWADAWAPADSSLRIVCAWSIPVSYAMADVGIDSELLQEGCEQTAVAAARLASEHPTDTRCVQGDARVVLAAEAEDADVLVIGARGHSGLSRLLLGSVAASLIHHLTVPTVLVRPIGADR